MPIHEARTARREGFLQCWFELFGAVNWRAGSLEKRLFSRGRPLARMWWHLLGLRSDSDRMQQSRQSS
jgi:hypothetical protein